jgi:hypothetical protein
MRRRVEEGVSQTSLVLVRENLRIALLGLLLIPLEEDGCTDGDDAAKGIDETLTARRLLLL